MVLLRFGIWPVIPILVQRELLASQTRGDFPLISAARANATGPERVPLRAASAHAMRANPAARAQRTPRAMRAVDLRLFHRSGIAGRWWRCVGAVARQAVDMTLGFFLQLELRQVHRANLLNHARDIAPARQHFVETRLHLARKAS